MKGTGQPTGNSESGLWGWGDSSCSPTPQVPHAGSRALLSTTAGSADHSQRQQPRTALCPRHREAQHSSSSTGTLLAAPFCAGANAQTDPTAQLVSSSLQVINEIIYCSLLGFCQNTRKKKKTTKKHNSYCQQNPCYAAGQLFAMPSENTVCSDPVHGPGCSQHSSDTSIGMAVTNRPLCSGARSSRAALHEHRAMGHTAPSSQQNPTDEWGCSSSPKARSARPYTAQLLLTAALPPRIAEGSRAAQKGITANLLNSRSDFSSTSRTCGDQGNIFLYTLSEGTQLFAT